MWWIYVLLCEGQRYYVGATANVAVRYGQHLRGQGGVFTRGHPPQCLVGAWPVGTRAQAQRLERKVKRWPPQRKLMQFHRFQNTWRRFGDKEIPMANNASIELNETLTILLVLDAQRQQVQARVWELLATLTPELVDLIRQTGIDDEGAAAWVNHPNTELGDFTPAQKVLGGHADEVIALVVRTLHGIR